MSDISLGDWSLLPVYWASQFLAGFIAGFYLSYLMFTKAKLQGKLVILLSILIGLFVGFFFFIPINYFTFKTYSFNNYYIYPFEYLPFVLVALEIAAAAFHFFYFRKQKKKR